MFLILPVTYEFETTLTPKRVIRKLNGELVEYRPSLNIMSTGKFMKAHRFESIFYGRETGEDFMLFYHVAKKRDGGGTGFYGHIEKTANGSKISGTFRKSKPTYVFAAIWTLVTLFFGLMMLALKIYAGAACCAAILLGGLFAMFFDSKKKYLLGYLDSFPKPAEDSEQDIAEE